MKVVFNLRPVFLYRTTFASRPTRERSPHHKSEQPPPILYFILFYAAGYKRRQGTNNLPCAAYYSNPLHTYRSKPLSTPLSEISPWPEVAIDPGTFPASAPVLLGLLFLFTLLPRLCRVNISSHQLSVFVRSFGINPVDPTL